MKKIILNATAIAVLLASSCKKNDNILPADNSHIFSEVNAMSATSSTVTVAQQGFLVFATRDNFADYVDFLTKSTLSEIQQYHATLGFKSLAGSDFSGVGPNGHLQEAQLPLFVLSSAGIFQIEHTIVKPTINNRLLMTMQSNQLKNNYDQFAAGTFNSGIMNQFAINSTSFGSGKGILNIVGTSPSGIADAPIQPPAQTMGWRVNRYYTDADGDGINDHYVDYWEYYLFGICLWGGGIYDAGNL